MEASEILDEILKNYSNANTVSLQIEAHSKNIQLLSEELKKSRDNGYKDGKKDGKKEKVENLIQKN
jgi:hypothetical protein